MNDPSGSRAHTRSSADTETGRTGFRPDIEGLRGIAVVAVLLYHASLPLVSGGYVGVDIFFVISGFLITGLLAAELDRTGTISARGFYARRVRRLLPSLAVVLAGVAIASWIVLSPLRRAALSGDLVAAGLYVVNWRFVAQSTDYMAGGIESSPVQHFWSLAVEEQFYLVWPLVLMAVALWCRWTGHSVRRALLVALTVVGGLSFGYCLYQSYVELDRAYFSTLTRGWELALGGLLALILARKRSLDRRLATSLAFAGSGAIVLAIVAFDDATRFPGVAGLLPTLGTAALIAAGTAGSSGLPYRLLVSRPIRHIGRISYVWYMWHWPFLVLARAQWGELSLPQTVLVVAASYVPALLTHRFVEEPFRKPAGAVGIRIRIRTVTLAAACSALAIVSGALLLVTAPVAETASKHEARGARAGAPSDSAQSAAKAIRPVPRDAAHDTGKVDAAGCLAPRKQTEPTPCLYGDKAGAKAIVLFGDSHAIHWSPALDKLASERGWKLIVLTKGGCAPPDVTTWIGKLQRPFDECVTWRAAALRQIEKLEPEMVVMSGLADYHTVDDGERMTRAASDTALVDGYVKTLRRLHRTGAQLVVIRDVPHPNSSVPDCVAGHFDDLKRCAIPRKEAFDYSFVGARAAGEVDGVRLVDPTPQLCTRDSCPAVIGNVLVYRTASHLTATYVETLTDWLGHQLPSRL